MNHIAADILMHEGVSILDGAPGRGSGRFALGSGENPYQHGQDIYQRIDELKKSGLFKETDIAHALGLSTDRLRIIKSIQRNEKRKKLADSAERLKNQGLGTRAIARKMDIPESTVRSLLDERSKQKMDQARSTADFLKEIVDKKGMVDVGAGVERELGVSERKLKDALVILEEEGYPTYGGRVPQVTNSNQDTTIKVLCPPGTAHRDIYKYDQIHSVIDYDYILAEDGTKKKAFEYPESLDSKRLKIRYAEEGGTDKDGVIEIRRGVKDLSLGKSNYAQVRILVDGTHYLKGMALYSDELPPGVDIIFNTNKKQGTPALGSDKNNTVLKLIKKDDPNNPFGSLLKPNDEEHPERGGQYHYIADDGKEKLGLINKTRMEGDWEEWSKKLPSQFLSKQNVDLIKKQLNISIADRNAELEELYSLTNPNLKKVLLNKFAEECDKASTHLTASSLPGQRYQVILPITNISNEEVYAPNFDNGDRVALVRFPHGGTFEIPILKVNNKNPEGKRTIGKAKDAVGINSHNAGILSGADFDGDTVLVIPLSEKVNITNRKPLPGLEGFEPKVEYGKETAAGPYKKMKNTQKEMGVISNLINDMTIIGATDDELARAVRHSMVVIDAEKHELDYQRSYKDNDIAALKRKYQGRVENGKYHEGAATLLSRANAQQSVVKRQGSPRVAEDGSLYYKTSDRATYADPKTGKTITKMQKSKQMLETKDARTLSTGTLKEEIYADYANELKRLANEARKTAVNTKGTNTTQSAKQTYQKEIASLGQQLKAVELNKPRERMAQFIATSETNNIFADNPDLTKKEKKKIRQQAITEARVRVGAKRYPIKISDSEWEAIQAGAITKTLQEEIFKYTDTDELRKRATPRSTGKLSDAKVAQIKRLLAIYNPSEVAERMNISVSTVHKYSKD